MGADPCRTRGRLAWLRQMIDITEPSHRGIGDGTQGRNCTEHERSAVTEDVGLQRTKSPRHDGSRRSPYYR